jgi:hypothetical protein
MLQTTTSLPPKLLSELADESVEFSVRSKSKMLKWVGVFPILFGVAWLAAVVWICWLFFGPLLDGEMIHFSVNGVPQSATKDDWKVLILPTAMLLLFLGVGFFVLGKGVHWLIKAEMVFVGTDQQLWFWSPKVMKAYPWGEFSEDMHSFGSEQKGTVVLMLKEDDDKQRYKPQPVTLFGVPQRSQIESICKKNIQRSQEDSIF